MAEGDTGSVDGTGPPYVRYHDVETCDCEVCTAVRADGTTGSWIHV